MQWTDIQQQIKNDIQFVKEGKTNTDIKGTRKHKKNEIQFHHNNEKKNLMEQNGGTFQKICQILTASSFPWEKWGT